MTEKPRYTFIDRYRGWAVIFMIETHIVNAFLHPKFRTTPWYMLLNFFNGLIAPSFLFLAGFSFAIVSGRKWDDFLHPGRAFFTQLRRYALILAVAYALHVPNYSFRVLFRELHWSQNHLFWGVDILHTIAVSLILMLLLLLCLRRQYLLFPVIGLLGLLISWFTRAIHALPIEKMVAAPFAGYFKRILWSQFPLFPWTGYIFLGAFVSYLWSLAKKKQKENLFFSFSAITGVGLITAIHFLQPGGWYRNASFNPVQPKFFFLKLGFVLIFISLFRLLESKQWERPRSITAIGQVSLPAYAFHILVIFGSYLPKGRYSLAHWLGKSMAPREILLFSLALILLTALFSLFWQKIKKDNPKTAAVLHIGFWLSVILYFSLH